MSAGDDDGNRLTIPKLSSFGAADEKKDSKPPKFSSFKPKNSPLPTGGGKESKPPKFASFKPKGSSGPRTGKNREANDRDSRKRSRHSDDCRHLRDSKQSRQGSRDHSRRRPEKPSKSEGRKESSDQSRSIPKSLKHGTGVSGLYIIDTKGDPLIRQYGAPHRSRVPSYLTYGSGRVLGTVGRLVMHHDGARDEFSLRMPGEGLVSLREKDGLRSRNWRVRSKAIRIRSDALGKLEDDGEDFLAVRMSKKRKLGHDHDNAGSSDDERPTYRSIEGKAKVHQYSDSDLDYDSPDEPVDADKSNPLKLKTIQLSRRVRDHPEDIDAWLELAEHQDALLRAGEDIDHKALENEVHSYSEIKLSMLESALSQVSSPEDRERVLVPLMREGVKVWNGKVAAKRWLELLDDENMSFRLWKTHLDSAMSDIGTFQYEDIRAMCINRIELLSKRSVFEVREDCSEAIYIFSRLTRFTHDAGYKELAVAAWQALLEYTFFRPTQTSPDDDAEKASFQDFWESEIPRIGDLGAKGWRAFENDRLSGEVPEPVHGQGDPDVQSRDPYKGWATVERVMAEKASLPARTMDEGTDDDPFRVVMVPDILPMLFRIPTSFIQELAPELCDAFLIFSRLPPAFRASDWTEAALDDQFLVGLPGGPESVSLEKPEANVSEETQRKQPSFDQGLLHAAPTSDILFSNKTWFSYISPTAKTREAEIAFVVNVTKQLVLVAGIEGLAEYYLALGSLKDANALKKTGKALLKQFPRNNGLYNAYALAEFANNNLEVATKVLASAAELVPGSSSSAVLELWRSWSWLEMELGSKRLATERLCCSVDSGLRKTIEETDISSTHILKAHQAFSSYANLLVGTGGLSSARIQVECLAMLAYLTADGCTEPTSMSQGNITAAMAVIHKASEDFIFGGHGKTIEHERILQFGARVLYLNASRGPFRRAYMLEELARFIDLFPRNTIFLTLFEWADSSLRVIDGVRTLLYEKVLIASQDCFTSRLFAIQHEIQHGNVNTAKSAFEHALSADGCRSSIPLWSCFIRFCYTHRTLRPKAKDVFFRGLRHCPWSKEIMMEAFVSLNRAMESAELRSVFNTMTSKGLRVHVDLEEYLEKRRQLDERKSLNGGQ